MRPGKFRLGRGGDARKATKPWSKAVAEEETARSRLPLRRPRASADLDLRLQPELLEVPNAPFNGKHPGARERRLRAFVPEGPCGIGNQRPLDRRNAAAPVDQHQRGLNRVQRGTILVAQHTTTRFRPARAGDTVTLPL